MSKGVFIFFQSAADMKTKFEDIIDNKNADYGSGFPVAKAKQGFSPFMKTYFVYQVVIAKIFS